MRYLLILLMPAMVMAQPATTVTTSPPQKSGDHLVFDETTQVVKQVKMSLDELISLKENLVKHRAKVNQRITKVTQLIEQAQAMGLKTLAEQMEAEQ